MATGRPDLILQYGDRAYSIWKHRPPIGSDRALRLRYSQAIESDIQKIVALAVEARTAGSGPISVSPFVSACIVEASALAADSTHTRQLDLENLHPQRAVENTLFTVIQDYQYTDIQGWWSQRGACLSIFFGAFYQPLIGFRGSCGDGRAISHSTQPPRRSNPHATIYDIRPAGASSSTRPRHSTLTFRFCVWWSGCPITPCHAPKGPC